MNNTPMTFGLCVTRVRLAVSVVPGSSDSVCPRDETMDRREYGGGPRNGPIKAR